jgi:hypothetical protein
MLALLPLRRAGSGAAATAPAVLSAEADESRPGGAVPVPVRTDVITDSREDVR